MGKSAAVFGFVLLCGSMIEGRVEAGDVSQLPLTSAIQLTRSLNDAGVFDHGLVTGAHILPAKTDAGKAARLGQPKPDAADRVVFGGRESLQKEQSISPSIRGGAKLPKAGGYFPADLSYFGGPVLQTAQQVIFTFNSDGNTSAWGNPGQFLFDLSASSFIHVTDQYVATKTSNRYPLFNTVFFGNHANGFCLSSSFCSMNDILEIVHQVAMALGGNPGYGKIIHIFLPQGTDTCFDVNNTQCYSPDNLPTMVFCAYHDSVTFNDAAGHVLFTVEPYQFINGCTTPNQTLGDATNSSLSHEVFETITDPDPPTGWLAVNSAGLFGSEIGDLCESPSDFEDRNILMSGRLYQLQLEYSNNYHACAAGP